MNTNKLDLICWIGIYLSIKWKGSLKYPIEVWWNNVFESSILSVMNHNGFCHFFFLNTQTMKSSLITSIHSSLLKSSPRTFLTTSNSHNFVSYFSSRRLSGVLRGSEFGYSSRTPSRLLSKSFSSLSSKDDDPRLKSSFEHMTMSLFGDKNKERYAKFLKKYGMIALYTHTTIGLFSLAGTKSQYVLI